MPFPNGRGMNPHIVLPRLYMSFVKAHIVRFCLRYGLAVLFLGTASAQPAAYEVHPDFVVKQWTVEEGLPGNAVYDIHQTQDGYFWLATGNGLARFDGLAFTAFTTLNTPALPNNQFAVLFESQAGDLWIQTQQSHLINYREGVFALPYSASGGRLSTTYKDVVSRRFLDEGDSLWIATDDGLSLYKDGRIEPYRPDEIQAKGWVLLRDRKGTLWMGTYSGDTLALTSDGSIRRYSTAEGLPRARIHDLLETADGTLWVSTRDGVFRLQHDGRFAPFLVHGKPYIVNARNLAQDANGQIHVAAVHHPSYRTRGIHAGWLTLSEKGTTSLDGILLEVPFEADLMRDDKNAYWRFQENRLYRGDKVVFSAQSPILTAHLDAEQNIWVGTQANGLYRLQSATFRTYTTQDGLPHAKVTTIMEDSQGRLWIGTAYGLVTLEDEAITPFDLLNGYRGRPSTYFPRKGYSRVQQPGDIVWGLYQSRSGTIWVGTNYEHCFISGARCIIPTLSGIPSDLYENVAAIHEDQQGRFWLGSKWGVIVGTPASTDTTWTHYDTEKGLTNNWIRSLYESPAGYMILGTYGGGLMRFAEGTFEALTVDQGLSSNNILDIHEDNEGALWIGTEDRGVCRLAYQDALPFAETPVQCISAAQGLTDNTIFRILEDDFGRMWMSSSRGIFWVNKPAVSEALAGQRPSVTPVVYTERDGLGNRQAAGGMQPAGIKASDGRLWFPTHDGVAVVDPAQIHVKATTIPLVVEALRVGTDPRLLGDAVTLAAAERNFEVDFTALNFTSPENVQIRYRLTGFEETWHNASLARTATYTNVSPGTYTFELQAGVGGVWQAPQTMFTIARLPFFWETNWFLVLTLLLGGLLVVALFRYRTHQIRMRNRELEQKVSERTAEVERQADELRHANELKSRFLANISHEFRTPLTLTLGPLTDLKEGRYGTLPPPAHHEIDRVGRNAERLLQLINQLLDLSKLEAGSLTLHVGQYDLVRFVRQRTSLFESLAETRSIAYRFITPLQTLPFNFDSDKLEKVLVNLLSNAFKFTPEGERITVALNKKDDAALIRVHDTGVGIAPEHLPHLFDRFYQVDGTQTRRHEGTGIGLSLVKELIALHKGTIDVASTLGIGTTFTIQLPYTPLAADHGGDGVSAPRKAPVPPVYALDAPKTADTTSSPMPEVSEEDMLVLIVEDNADMRAYITSHLTGLFTLVEAENGRIGLERAQALVPDLVLSDLMMPEMDGFALCDALKTDARTSHIPVVLLTAKADTESRLTGFHTGADAYLAKPFNAEELRLRVGKLIEQRRALRKKYSHDILVLKAEQVELPAQEVSFLQNVQQTIEAELGNADFTVDALAEAVHMSRRQLLRKVRALTDETPNALIRRMRLERAAQMLRQSSGSVKEIAYATGFKSDSYFTKAFRQQYNVAPTAYATSPGAA